MNTTQQNRRKHERFEPRAVDAIVQFKGGEKIGPVLDASESGLALSFRQENGGPASLNQTVKVSVKYALPESHTIAIGDATVLRQWPTGSSGLALVFGGSLPDDAAALLLKGSRKDSRVKNQTELADIDIDKVHSHILSLHECQLKLFMIALTVAVALGSAYLTLSYHSAVLATSQPQLQYLSYWRMWLAFLPSLLALAIASMITQKIASVARDEAFLSVIKECRVSGQFPREYRGWEDAYRRLKHCWRSSLCQRACTNKKKCGQFTYEENQIYSKMKLLFNAKVNLFHVVIYATLFSIFLFSMVAVFYEIRSYQMNSRLAITIGATFGGLVTLFLIALFWILFQIRVGRYSFAARRCLWSDIMEQCPFKV